MRRKLIAANWKMNMAPTEARALIAALRAQIDGEAAELARDRDVIIAPPAISIFAAAQALAGSNVALGAQNMYFEDKGAFTGEVSPAMLRAMGVTCVILGHSERRHVFGETNDLINKKVLAALRHRLTPILCVGETQTEHDAGREIEVVFAQLEAGLKDVPAVEAKAMVLAYEPVWAIGTGRNATPEQAQLMHVAIRKLLADRFDETSAKAMRIIYGGSVTPDNIDSLASKPDIDGALVGGASLKADSFARIVKARTA